MPSMQLPAVLTLPQAGGVVAQLQAAIAQAAPGDAFQVDAAALAEFDTSALAVLLEGSRVAHQRGCGYAVMNPPPKLVQLATLYGVEALLGLQPVAA
jgi:phospholipid transport system transporter-binding protein